MIELEFYEGDRRIGVGRWPYIPPDGMRLRLELREGTRVVTVFSSEGQGVVKTNPRPGDVPTFLCRPVRVMVGDLSDLDSVISPGDLPPAPGPPGRGRR